MVAMAGKNCVAIASDTRLSTQFMTIDQNFKRIWQVNDRTMLGLGGLGTDVQTFDSLMKFKLNLYNLKEGRDMKASVFSQLVATSLYERRYARNLVNSFRFGPYFVAPIVAGLDQVSETEFTPVITTYDSIGYRQHSGLFETAGTGSELLYGICESFFKPDLEPEALFEVISNCLLSAIDRDAHSGWGAVVYILTPNELIVRRLKTRGD